MKESHRREYKEWYIVAFVASAQDKYTWWWFHRSCLSFNGTFQDDSWISLCGGWSLYQNPPPLTWFEYSLSATTHGVFSGQHMSYDIIHWFGIFRYVHWFNSCSCVLQAIWISNDGWGMGIACLVSFVVSLLELWLQMPQVLINNNT